jgi:hypothetical protein
MRNPINTSLAMRLGGTVRFLSGFPDASCRICFRLLSVHRTFHKS